MHAGPAHTDPSRDAPPPTNRPCCPLCNGPLMPLGNSYRCNRCFFTLCVGCDSADAGDHAASE